MNTIILAELLFVAIILGSVFIKDEDKAIRAYIEQHKALAVAEMEQYHIPASLLLALAIQRSQAGTTTIAIQYNNHFGIQCKPGCTSYNHCVQHERSNRRYRKYDDLAHAYESNSIYICCKFNKSLQHGADYANWAQDLQEGGYDKDPFFAHKVCTIIRNYELHKLDTHHFSTQLKSAL